MDNYCGTILEINGVELQQWNGARPDDGAIDIDLVRLDYADHNFQAPWCTSDISMAIQLTAGISNQGQTFPKVLPKSEGSTTKTCWPGSTSKGDRKIRGLSLVLNFNSRPRTRRPSSRYAGNNQHGNKGKPRCRQCRAWKLKVRDSWDR